MLKKVAVTGGLSCGKSSVCQLFKKLGAYVVSADEIVHQLLSPNTNIGQEVISLIGSESISNQTLDRNIIAMKVFQDNEKLKALEAILHPAVRCRIEEEYAKASLNPTFPLFVAEIPLLFETGMAQDFDATIAIYVPTPLCMMRYKTGGHTEQDFLNRTARQLSPEEKAAQATYIIDNSGEFTKTTEQVEALFHALAA